MTDSLGVVIPAYAPDTERLATYVRTLREELSPETIRIELDDPTTGVSEAVRELPAEVNVAPGRRGKGAAVTAGFEALETDVHAFVDADGATPASSLAEVIAPVADDGADLSVGSRRHPESTVRSHQTFARRHLGDAYAWLGRRVLDVSLSDYQCGAKALTAGTWRQVRGHLHASGFAWDIELVAVAHALGSRVVEVPVIWEDQPGSTVSPVGDALAMGRGLLMARHRARRVQGGRLHEALGARWESRPLVDRVTEDA